MAHRAALIALHTHGAAAEAASDGAQRDPDRPGKRGRPSGAARGSPAGSTMSFIFTGLFSAYAATISSGRRRAD